MKKVLFILLAIAPFAMTAQTKIAPANDQASKEIQMRNAQREAAGKGNIDGESMFCELILSDNGVGGLAIRFDFGQESIKGSDDKEFIDALGKAREQKFSNVPDAMVYLNKMGFRFLTSYVNTVGKSETHMVFEKKIVKRGNRPGDSGLSKPSVEQKPVTDDSKTGGSKPAPAKTDQKSGKK